MQRRSTAGVERRALTAKRATLRAPRNGHQLCCVHTSMCIQRAHNVYALSPRAQEEAEEAKVDAEREMAEAVEAKAEAVATRRHAEGARMIAEREQQVGSSAALSPCSSARPIYTTLACKVLA
jgi:hypothetical protein